MNGPNIFESIVGGALSNEMPALLEALRGIHKEIKRHNDATAAALVKENEVSVAAKCNCPCHYDQGGFCAP